MFNTLNSRYQRLLTSTVEISIYVVKIISFYFLLYKIHIDIIHILRKKLSRIYNMNTCNTYLFEYLQHAGSCSRCFIMKSMAGIRTGNSEHTERTCRAMGLEGGKEEACLKLKLKNGNMGDKRGRV